MLTVEQERSLPVELDVDRPIHVGTFSANGEYLAGWDWRSVGVWRVEGGKQMATMEAFQVQCLAVSNDGRWIAAGTSLGDTLVWDANTYEQVFAHREAFQHIRRFRGVHFSPDSTRLISASDSRTAIVWDIATHRKVQTLHHDEVAAANYSPQGDRIATASGHVVRVWDSNDGHLLVEIRVKMSPWYNTGLLWFHNHLFVLSKGEIKEFDASTGSALSEWSVPGADFRSCIALPKHGEFVACSTESSITFWDTSTHRELGVIQTTENPSIAFSPDSQFLVIGGEGRKITVQSLSHIYVSIVSLWNMTYVNMFLAPLAIPNRIQSHPLVYNTLSRNLTFRSTTLRWIHGNTISSQTRRRY